MRARYSKAEDLPFIERAIYANLHDAGDIDVQAVAITILRSKGRFAVTVEEGGAPAMFFECLYAGAEGFVGNLYYEGHPARLRAALRLGARFLFVAADQRCVRNLSAIVSLVNPQASKLLKVYRRLMGWKPEGIRVAVSVADLGKV